MQPESTVYTQSKHLSENNTSMCCTEVALLLITEATEVSCLLSHLALTHR